MVFTSVFVGVDYGESLNGFKREWENHHRLEEYISLLRYFVIKKGRGEIEPDLEIGSRKGNYYDFIIKNYHAIIKTNENCYCIIGKSHNREKLPLFNKLFTHVNNLLNILWSIFYLIETEIGYSASTWAVILGNLVLSLSS